VSLLRGGRRDLDESSVIENAPNSSDRRSRVVILFDIDGTLVDCAGSGRAAMREGFRVATGRADAVDSVVFGGMTDRAIARIGLENLGKQATMNAIDEVLAAYLEVLPRLIAAEPRFRVIEGASDLVSWTSDRGFVVGLGTGNLRAGARIKLSHAKLDDAFAFGGFGCDAEDRAELLRIGYERGRSLGRAERGMCVVIGDTPRDISAARAIGARVVAVATGKFNADLLEEHAPDLLVESLADDRVRRFLIELPDA
jgi:phosphoglycolate phosphatase